MNQRHNTKRSDNFFLFENNAYASGYRFVAGVDEAGRGPLAGPVVAAACLVEPGHKIRGVNDSKQLTAMQRKDLYEKITNDRKIQTAIVVIASGVIDVINILQASLLAMKIAVMHLSNKPDYVLIDGNCIPSDLPIPANPIVSGDSRSFSIAAASILAKHKRDEIMDRYDEIWPEYGFASHKGYGTKAHLLAIQKHGLCPIHRMTFEPAQIARYAS